MPNASYDYIIVGAGSAGCVLAARLSEDRDSRVLLLEAGGSDRAKEVRIPAAFSRLFKSPRDWNYETEPEPHLNGRRLYWPRGKMLGGSSSMNAMIYSRGNPADYDNWQRLGNDGWSWSGVLPYFKKSEHQERGEGELHARGGPLHVSDPRYVNPLTRAFVGASLEIGIDRNADFNGITQEGVGLYQLTQRNGRRSSAADAFLKPVLRRRNLTVLTNAHATRLLVENRRAIGVEFISKGASKQVRAERELILSGGAVNSPQLLLLSGIGPGNELSQVGIRPVHDLPGVGKNLQDHVMVSVAYLSKRPVSLASAQSLPNFLWWQLVGRGPLSSNVAEAGIFLRTEKTLCVPDLQVLFGPAYYVNHGLDRRPDHSFGFGPTLLAPESLGSISLRSANPLDKPAIRANYLSSARDMRVMTFGVRLCRTIARAKPFDPYRGEELYPGPAAQTDDELELFLRASVETLYHPVGTCKMGIDPLAVVDPALRVRGIDGLRVVDASVMPRIISGNTNAPTIMIAEKAADMIRAAN